jgi:hypothetical protein
VIVTVREIVAAEAHEQCELEPGVKEEVSLEDEMKTLFM